MPINPGDPNYQKQAAEVERLLRKLRPEPPEAVTAPVGPPRSRPRPGGSPAYRPRPMAAGGARPTTAGRPGARPGTRPGMRPVLRPLPSPAGVWARVGLALLLAGAMFLWPYRACGLLLVPYFAAAAMVLLVGAWAGEASWRRRMGPAHTLAIVILLAGAAVVARPLLPHVYDGAETTWRCAR